MPLLSHFNKKKSIDCCLMNWDPELSIFISMYVCPIDRTTVNHFECNSFQCRYWIRCSLLSDVSTRIQHLRFFVCTTLSRSTHFMHYLHFLIFISVDNDVQTKKIKSKFIQSTCHHRHCYCYDRLIEVLTASHCTINEKIIYLYRI